MKKILSLLIVLMVGTLTAQRNWKTPAEKRAYSEITYHAELATFMQEAKDKKNCTLVESIAKTAAEKEVIMAVYTLDKKPMDPKKLRVLFFAQQHGNEHSGKEALMALMRNLSSGKLDHLLEKMDIIIIPQVNPDGSDKDMRRNANDVDLNRNHLILTQNESIALHELYYRYMPDLTLDVHEYFPWDDSTSTYPYVRNIDEQLGVATNINISQKMRDFSRLEVLPFVGESLQKEGYTFGEYAVGSISYKEPVRHSTVDIDDGRQSFGILGSLCFIAEGLNGKTATDNLERRTKAQLLLCESLLQFAELHASEIKNMVTEERMRIQKGKEAVAIRMDHQDEGKQITIPMINLLTGKDSVIQYTPYLSQVIAIDTVKVPKGYLVPKNDKMLMQWLKNHHIQTADFTLLETDFLQTFRLENPVKIKMEDMYIVDAELATKQMTYVRDPDAYVYVPCNQIQNNLLVLALEPKSGLGLINYPDYIYFTQSEFPILRLD